MSGSCDIAAVDTLTIMYALADVSPAEIKN